jgi:hypothetical protein
MTEQPFSNREIDKKFQDQSTDLKLYMASLINPLTTQVSYTNGKVKRLTLVLTIVATATATLLFTNGSELAEFVLRII